MLLDQGYGASPLSTDQGGAPIRPHPSTLPFFAALLAQHSEIPQDFAGFDDNFLFRFSIASL
ncbi:hypothetical protein AUQ43_13625 [Thalassospira sp. MCCC 1A01148]|uniref:Uncharacterized protein n=1 Tax=Thalassospira profundimaris TaxID=502049 RepID=A0A367V712_9PROT|nr:hypothetical protein AUQ43_13625 [Thalassospira sp. MCCC 1A01148]RCK20988.1 hypothetical protein TH6_14505 [Thalassospira profundimaris]